MDPYKINSYNGGGNMASLDMQVSQVMKHVYFRMFLALLVTAGAAWICAGIPNLVPYLATHSWVYWGLLIAEVVIVLAITGAMKRLSSSTATLLFFAFALLNGVTFSLFFAVYTTVSIFKTFLIAAGVFGAMTVYGYLTNQDLTRIGNFLFMALIGLIIVSLVNMFWANSTLEWIVSIVGVLIFIGLTAYDTQTIKRMAESGMVPTSMLATLGALSLYLDFINLFVYLLRFFGSSRD